jgi:hypothetical protein
MSGGFSRQYVIRCIAAVILLSALTGCSTLFGPKPVTQAEQPAAPPEPASEPEASASAPETASTPVAEPNKPEVAEAKRAPPKKPAYRPPAHAREPAAPPAIPHPSVPPPLITTRVLPPEQMHGLLDTKVQRPDGKIIGRAINMSADMNGKPTSMLVNLAGFMGVGDRKMRFPWSAFHFGPSPKKAPITLDLSPNEPPAAQAARPRAKDARAASKALAAREPLSLPLIDATVERRNGDRVGRVIDVLIDTHAQPQAAVLDVGNLINHGRRSIAADWSALHFIVAKDNNLELHMDLSDAQIEAAPPYDADQAVRAVSPASAASPSAAASGSTPGLASTARPQR